MPVYLVPFAIDPQGTGSRPSVENGYVVRAHGGAHRGIVALRNFRDADFAAGAGGFAVMFRPTAFNDTDAMLLADGLDTAIKPAKSLIESRLGVTVDDVTNPGRLLASLLINRLKVNPTRNKYEILLGGQRIFEMAPVGGGDTQHVADSFNRGDAGTLGTADTGGSWTEVNNGSTYAISSNTCLITGGTSLDTVAWVYGSDVAEAYALCTVNISSSTGQDFGPYMCAVRVGNGNTANASAAHYSVRMRLANSRAELMEKTSTTGATVLDDTGNESLSYDTTYNARCKATGSTISASVWTGSDPGDLLTATDTTITTGRYGMQSANENTETATIDAFEGWEIGAGATTRRYSLMLTGVG